MQRTIVLYEARCFRRQYWKTLVATRISPLLSNVYLAEVDRMLERAKEATRNGKYTYVEYARFADDLVVLIDAHPRNAWLLGAVNKRLREELAKLQVEINEVRNRRGFGWKRRSRRWLYEELKLFNGYQVRRGCVPKALPA